MIAENTQNLRGASRRSSDLPASASDRICIEINVMLTADGGVPHEDAVSVRINVYTEDHPSEIGARPTVAPDEVDYDEKSKVGPGSLSRRDTCKPGKVGDRLTLPVWSQVTNNNTKYLKCQRGDK